MKDEVSKELNALTRSNQELQARLDSLQERVRMLESDNDDLSRRCAEAEDAHLQFVNLYVAAQRLSSTLDIQEILEVLKEIVVNLVGSEQFGLFFLSDDTGETPLVLATEVYGGGKPVSRPSADHPAIRKALETGELYVADNCDAAPAAAIPLLLDDQVLGVLVLYGLLPQKSGFTQTDMELFQLLVQLAGRAFYAALMALSRGSAEDIAGSLRRKLCGTTA